ncbi:MAG: hypothetical protein RQ748_09695 [Elusimicrobiales bacterium]|nr:hypothetical protein [Elusimicrobiales bacterium]
MKFTEFKAKFLGLPVIPSRLLSGGQADINQLERWRRSGRIVKLRRGLYMLGAGERRLEPGRAYLAGQIYQPSYVSLEYALSVYGLIPERPADMTSVSARKTAVFVNDFGTFSYQSVKPSVFRGFTAVKDETGFPYFMAEPEKAVADFVYLNLGKCPSAEKEAGEYLAEAFRFQDLASLRRRRLKEYFALFGMKKMDRIADAILGLAGGGA